MKLFKPTTFIKNYVPIIAIIGLLFSLLLPLNALRVSAASTNLIANASVETAATGSTTLPSGWSQDSWGTNTHTFSYLKTGHTGSKSVQVSITKYTSGDAKWDFTPVAVSGSTTYAFSDYYKSTIASSIVAEVADTSGNLTYIDVGTAAKATAWTQYNGSFTTPANAKTVTIFHLINAVGSLTVDDASLSASTTTTPTPPAATTSIANPSFETASTTKANTPDGWSADSWGTNTPTFSYLTTGHTGTKSAQVAITKYTSGDAKWNFTPVAVTPNTSYNFSDYYKSTITSSIVAQYDDGAGNLTYQDLGTAAKATAWTQYKTTLTTPATAKKVTIFHLIAAVGSLTIDDAAFAATTTTTPTPPATPNPVPNPSVETATAGDTTTPQNWYKGYWGNNTAVFSYGSPAHTGSKSVKVTMSKFVDGGANWTYDAVAVTGGKTYEFSDYYQSNVATQALVAIKMSDGTTQYLWLGNPYTSDGTWTHFYKEFTMPVGAVSAVAYQSISANGYVMVDDVTLRPSVVTGFSSPLVTLTFDDSLESQYTNGLPILQKYGLKGTFYAISGDLNTCDGPLCYMTNQQLKNLYTSGNEIGSHTVSHPDLTSLTATQLTQELSQSQASIAQITGAPITSLAAPYGSVNLQVLTESQKYYTAQRGVQLGYNDINNYNQQNLLVQDINSSTTVAQVKSYIDYAKATNTWLILMYHDINADNTIDPGYNTTPTDFDAHMAYLKASGITVQTMAQALATVTPQLPK